MGYYEFELRPTNSAANLAYSVAYSRLDGWRWMGYGYFAPLAVDPAAARAALSPALLKLIRELKVARWSEGSMLFVWVHDALPLPVRTNLAEAARRIHRLLTQPTANREAVSR